MSNLTEASRGRRAKGIGTLGSIGCPLTGQLEAKGNGKNGLPGTDFSPEADLLARLNPHFLFKSPATVDDA
jgi:hypothetical protein